MTSEEIRKLSADLSRFAEEHEKEIPNNKVAMANTANTLLVVAARLDRKARRETYYHNGLLHQRDV